MRQLSWLRVRLINSRVGFAGEINTLQGNLNWVASREHSLTHPAWDGREADFLPLTSPAASDSANLDMLAEFLVRSRGSGEIKSFCQGTQHQRCPISIKHKEEVTGALPSCSCPSSIADGMRACL